MIYILVSNILTLNLTNLYFNDIHDECSSLRSPINRFNQSHRSQDNELINRDDISNTKYHLMLNINENNLILFNVLLIK